MAPVHFAFFVLIHLIWALAVVLAKVGMADLPPLVFSGLRFLLVSLLLFPVLEIHKGRMKQIAAVAMFAGGLNFALFFTGLHIAEDVSTIAVVGQLSVPFSVIMSIVFLGEHVGWRRWLGIALSFSGVMVISFDPRVLTYLDGVVLGILGALMGSASMIFQRALRNVGIFELQAWVAMLSWPVLLGTSAVIETGQFEAIATAGWQAWSALVFTALISSLIAHAGMFYLIQRYEVSQLAPLSLMAPLFMIVLGVSFLGDELTWRMILGGAVVLSGVLIISIRQPSVSGARTGDGPLPGELESATNERSPSPPDKNETDDPVHKPALT